MKKKTRTVVEIILLLLVAATSVLIFVHRNQLRASNVVLRWGYIGIFFLCFLSNATVFLPAPSLMVVVGAAMILPPLPVAIVGSLGSMTGELTGYVCGRAGEDLSTRFSAFIERLRKKLRRDWLIVFLLALLPLPLFDLAGVYSGGSRMPLWRFASACWCGKFLKMLAYAHLSYLIDIAGPFL